MMSEPQLYSSISVGLTQLHDHPAQPRFIEDKGADADLVASIKRAGVLTPIVVRETEGVGQFEILAGHRRVRCARAAGLKEVPCVCREVDDKEAAMIVSEDNVRRKDLHPLEEARGLELMVAEGWKLPEIAERLNRSPGWVARRLNLGKLHKDVRKAVLDPKHPMRGASVKVLERLAALPGDVQAGMMAAGKRDFERGDLAYPFEDAEELEGVLRSQYLLVPEKACFDHTDPTLAARRGPCVDCPDRTANQAVLWDDFEKEDKCLNPPCFAHKVGLHVSRRHAEMRTKLGGQAASLVVVGERHHDLLAAVPDDIRNAMQRKYDVTPGKKSDPKARPALFVSPTSVRTGWVTARTSAGRSSSSGAKITAADLRARKRKNYVADHVFDIVQAAAMQDRKLHAGLGPRGRPYTAKEAQDVARLHEVGALAAALLDQEYLWDLPAGIDEGRRLYRSPPGHVFLRLQALVLRQLDSELARSKGRKDADAYLALARKVAPLIDVDLKPIERAAAQKHPEPAKKPASKARAKKGGKKRKKKPRGA